jgi:CheY-like chemotaxis protein
LIAEDNQVNQKMLVLMLKRLGPSADVVNNGAEAIAACHHRIYDLVLMDIQMPEMDGLEATQSIRKEYSSGQQPLIVAVTANVLQEDLERCLAIGMDDYMGKPIRLEKLVKLLSYCQTRTSESMHLSQSPS